MHRKISATILSIIFITILLPIGRNQTPLTNLNIHRNLAQVCSINNCEPQYCKQGICQFCQVSHYQSDDKTLCIPCIDNCYACAGPDVCKDCKLLYGLNDDKKCTLCSTMTPNCHTCEDKNCLSCHIGFYLEQSNFNCLSCSHMTNCIHCSDKITCQQCKPGLNLFVNEDGKCQQCKISNCLLCKQFTKDCHQCAVNYIWNAAVSKCQTCLTVLSNCLTCFDNDECDLCANQYMLSSNRRQCIPAISLNCVKSQMNSCLSCSDGYQLDPHTNRCISKAISVGMIIGIVIPTSIVILVLLLILYCFFNKRKTIRNDMEEVGSGRVSQGTIMSSQVYQRGKVIE